MIGIILIILVLGSWLLQQLVTFTATLFNGLPNLVPKNPFIRSLPVSF
jgi:flagellar biosynthesis protein FliQ